MAKNGFTPDIFAIQLLAGLEALDLQLDEDQQQKLIAYLEQILKWNKTYNLSAIRDPDLMVSQMLLDSLVGIPYLSGERILDVGSGSGLPGIPLALACPERNFTLLDSNGKKTRFIKQIVMDLQIPNVDVVQSRVEEFQPEQSYELVISRAFSELSKFISLTGHLLAENGAWLAWKGAEFGAELEQLGADYSIEQIPVNYPGMVGNRSLVSIKKSSKIQK